MRYEIRTTRYPRRASSRSCAPVAFEVGAGVERPPVELQDEPVSDEKIDMTHAGNGHLGTDARAQSMQKQARDGLQT